MTRRSLERHLSRSLALAIVAVGLVAALASFWIEYFHAKRMQDEALREIAGLAASGKTGLDRRRLLNANAMDGTIDDPDSPVLIAHFSPANGAKWPVWVPEKLAPGFHTVPDGSGKLRIFLQETGGGGFVAVGQDTEVREDSAVDGALYTLGPQLLLLPLLVWLVRRIVHTEMATVRELAAQADELDPERLHLLSDHDVPDELSSLLGAMNRLLARIKILLAEQRRFIADAAHELRTPLAALSLQVQNLDSANTMSDVRDRMVPVRVGIERTKQVTEQLLSLSRAQASETSKSPTDVSRLARELIADYLPMAADKRVDLGLEQIATLHLDTNAEMLRLILKNGLDNAVRYSPAYGEVTIRLRRDRQYAIVEVLDAGPGIPADKRERVFDPFYRIAGSPGGGSGLGLAIAREAASRIGGSVCITDRPDRPGTLFRYWQIDQGRPAPQTPPA